MSNRAATSLVHVAQGISAVQEHTDSLESKLAKTSAQLKELQKMQESINAKNEMLVRLLQLSKQAESKPSPDLPAATAVGPCQAPLSTLVLLQSPLHLCAIHCRSVLCNPGFRLPTPKVMQSLLTPMRL